MTETAPDPLDGTRASLLAAALSHIPFDGWSLISLNKAARDLGIEPGAAAMAFPGGPADLLDLHAREADSRMLAQAESLDIASMRMRDRIRAVVRARFDAVAEHREAERRALGFVALPRHAPQGARMLMRTVDLMWRAAGDTSTDFSFYTKRTTLAGVYSSTMLFWMADSSGDSAETWAFLDRRIEDVMNFEKAKARAKARLKDTPTLAALLARLRYPGEARMKP